MYNEIENVFNVQVMDGIISYFHQCEDVANVTQAEDDLNNCVATMYELHLISMKQLNLFEEFIDKNANAMAEYLENNE